jgi:hypothetical protein
MLQLIGKLKSFPQTKFLVTLRESPPADFPLEFLINFFTLHFKLGIKQPQQKGKKLNLSNSNIKIGDL